MALDLCLHHPLSSLSVSLSCKDTNYIVKKAPYSSLASSELIAKAVTLLLSIDHPAQDVDVNLFEGTEFNLQEYLEVILQQGSPV